MSSTTDRSESRPSTATHGTSGVRIAAAPYGPDTGPQNPRPGGCTAVLFGATGDLAGRKLVPALYNLAALGSLPEHFAVLGFSRSAGSDDELRTRLRASLERFSRTQPIDEAVWDGFGSKLHATAGDIDDPRAYVDLRERLEAVETAHSTGGHRLFYLATPASAFPKILTHLHGAGLIQRSVEGAPPETPWSRVIVEKPFGHDLASARALNQLALEFLREEQIYRIDHYLGKETVQNILAVRFGNSIFEPLWNRRHIDHVQITMAESIGVEGRGAFYEETGVLRDIVQNHLLQVLALCAMEPPVSFEADEIRNMKAQVLRSLRPITDVELERNAIRGQYEGYHDERGVAPDSRTPTYVALRARIDNWRWQGVPFYLRAGKGLAARETEIAIHFRGIPHSLFGDETACLLIPSNVLHIRIQPDEGIALRIASKIPGEDLRMGAVSMDFRYADAFACQPAEAYERLLLDAMRGDPTLFARRDEVELSWRFCTQLLEAWDAADRSATGVRPSTYAVGSQGPALANELLRVDHRAWEPIGS